MSYSCDHSDDDPLMKELRELRLADEARVLGSKVDENIHLANAQFISDCERNRLQGLTPRQNPEKKKLSRKT